MNFRIPHPFENVGDAIKDALDPDTPADGGLVTQLMNENNRAIEDAINRVGGGLGYFSDSFTLDGSGAGILNVTNPASAKTGFAFFYFDFNGFTGPGIAWLSFAGSVGPIGVNINASGEGGLGFPFISVPPSADPDFDVSVSDPSSPGATVTMLWFYTA